MTVNLIQCRADQINATCEDHAFQARDADFVKLGPALRLVRVRSFNTTSSMGRLTLNVLLSFAQFERGEISLFASDKILI